MGDRNIQITVQIDRRVGIALGALAIVAVPAWLFASNVTGLTSFSNNTVADANAVNGNFAALAGAVNDNDDRLDRFTFSGTQVGIGGTPLADFDVKGNERVGGNQQVVGTVTAGDARISGFSRLDDLRIMRFHATCQARFGSTYAMVAAVSPPFSANSLAVGSRMTGNSVCSTYVGNNNISGWTCLGVPYVYDYDRDDGWLGTDVRPSWGGCTTQFPDASGGYRWIQPGQGGEMMACCGHN